ncbi:uroporphyrinogen-III C-methyltransferase [Desmospora profundinema]|uniref:uroporphyrinogen-III C-methyltransferase n=1 Tax=Desmospora profundinema TaxID=1571184 RepID=A0ABU1IH79_9BACL|nr:uroporphyrinogen-III C-methyltransferase [Desmospora profundinema]MDR6224134.1 uroporphyrinogen III methyltransferase/synthase [Desmospora profundinema]
MASLQKGFVYLVGAGPGDPGLITVKGREALQEADVVLYDRLVSPRLLENTQDYCERVDVGKRPSSRWTQEEINRTLIRMASEGKTVVRLKGGDPFVFGRGGEEAASLRKASIPFEVVPGISSVTAVPAYAGIPVTHRDYNSSFTVVAGHEHPDKKESAVKWEHLAKGSETLIILMGMANLPRIRDVLLRYGRSPGTPVALVRWGTRSNQETLTGTLADIAERAKAAAFRPPAVIIVGEVVRERERLTWFELLPLFGRQILVPRTRKQRSLLSAGIEQLGGEAVEFPVADLKMAENAENVIKAEPMDDWLVFTSASGVEVFFRILEKTGKDIRQWANAQVAAVGKRTAVSLKEKGIQADVFVDTHSAGLMEAMGSLVKTGDRVLLVGGGKYRITLASSLQNRGCQVRETEAIETRTVYGCTKDAVRMLQAGEVDMIAFASSSTVRHLVEAIRPELAGEEEALYSVPVACIGPETAQAAEECGWKVDKVACPHTVEGLIDALCHLSEERQTALAATAEGPS